MNCRWKEKFRLVPSLALLAHTSPAFAYTSQAEVNEAWPMCNDTPYRIEPWQVIEPRDLTASTAERALECLAEHQKKYDSGPCLSLDVRSVSVNCGRKPFVPVEGTQPQVIKLMRQFG